MPMGLCFADVTFLFFTVPWRLIIAECTAPTDLHLIFRIGTYMDGQGLWPWPWSWIGSYSIPSCITRWPLPACQISLKSKKLLWTDGRTDGRADGHLRPTLIGRLGGVDLKIQNIKTNYKSIKHKNNIRYTTLNLFKSVLCIVFRKHPITRSRVAWLVNYSNTV